MKVFVVSYGGSGSWTLVNYLNTLNIDSYHIHSRTPPQLICDSLSTSGHFDYTNLIPGGKVIFIYRKPIYSLLSSKSSSITHFKNIAVNEEHSTILKSLGFTLEANTSQTTIKDYLTQNKDIINYENFFDNYYNCNFNKNYEILCVNFDHLWTHIEAICKFVGKEYDGNLPPREKKEYDDYLVSLSNKLFYNIKNKIDKITSPKIITPNHYT